VKSADEYRAELRELKTRRARYMDAGRVLLAARLARQIRAVEKHLKYLDERASNDGTGDK
jgi:hypothetical protein